MMSSTETSGRDGDHFLVDVNVVVGAGIAVVALLCVTAIIMCGMKVASTARQEVTLPQPHPVEELAMVERRAVRVRHSVELEDETSGQSVHEYFYVPDSPPPSDEDEFADNEPPPPVCHGPGNPPDDYLNPEPSRDETEEEGVEFNTVPFYENTQLRPVEATGTSHRTSADNTETGVSEKVLASNAETVNDFACVENSNFDTTESGYMRYSPPLYENAMP